jgi:membrane protein implicated in regulation of membrane protease activity
MMEMVDSWAWLVFVVVGLLLVLAELFLGVEAGLDLVMLGSAFILGALATAYFRSWVLTLGGVAALCLLYVAVGRKYTRRTTRREARTNVEALLGREGVLLRPVGRNRYGVVKVGGEEWRAESEQELGEGEEVVVTGIKGVTLIVERRKEVQSQWKR